MKLNPNQLPQHLQQGPLAPVYLFAGDEPLLIQEAADSLRQTARAAGFNERDVLHAESGFQWEELLNRANSMSLFADKTLLELHIPNGKPGTKGSDILSSYLESPSPDTLLVIYCPRLEASAQKSKWFKAIDSIGATLAFWPIEPQQLPSWISQRLQQAGMSASREAAQLLADRVEGNLLAAIQEIEKLRLQFGEKPLDVEDILEGVADSARYDVFTLTDAALAGEQQRSLKILHGLKAEGVASSNVLWALSREIRTLLLFSQQNQGNPLSEAQFKKHRIWGKRKSLFNRSVARHSEQKLATLIQRCSQVDKAIKGAKTLDPWLQLTDIVVDLSA